MKLLSVDSLYKSLFLLLRISGVISKYHSLLLSGILKLFYVDRDGIHLFFKVILAKWPISISKKVRAFSLPLFHSFIHSFIHSFTHSLTHSLTE